MVDKVVVKVPVEVVEFECIMRQVKSMADHSINVTINLPEYQIDKASALMKHIDGFSRGAFVFEIIDKQQESIDAIRTRPERKSSRSPA